MGEVMVWGAGSWGTALAMSLARQGRAVRLVARHPDIAQSMQDARENKRYLPDMMFPEHLRVVADVDASLERASAVVVALPCSATLQILPHISGVHKPVILACKGLHPDTLQRMDEVLLSHVDAAYAALLSGPSFAREVATGMPTAITMAASSLEVAEHAAAFFDDPAFRIYTSDDMVGVALGGALKNVIAIAAGVAEGLGLGHNTAAALITRGIVEITRLAVACGAKPETLSGLSGLGDLVLTCTGALSRNRQMGMALASGMSVDAARQQVGQVVEGERSARAVCRLAEQMDVEMPISRCVFALLQGHITAKEGLEQLLMRPSKRET